LASVQLTRDADVQFYTGLSNTNVFKTLFDHLNLKASVMHYWKVPRQTLKQAPMRYFMDDDPSLFLKPFEAQWKVFFNYMFCRSYNTMA
jgi:hypothetical protein